MKKSSFDATILALDVETSAFVARRRQPHGGHSIRRYRRSMRRRRRSMRRRLQSRGVTGDIGVEFPAISAIAELV